jgi:hypothetical protein
VVPRLKRRHTAALDTSCELLIPDSRGCASTGALLVVRFVPTMHSCTPMLVILSPVRETSYRSQRLRSSVRSRLAPPKLLTILMVVPLLHQHLIEQLANGAVRFGDGGSMIRGAG